MPDVPVYFTGGGRAKIKGSETGRVYKFEVGIPTPVHPDDVEALLAMTRKGKCCSHDGSGATWEVNLFAIE